MKGTRIYIIGIILLLAGLFLIEMSMPRKFTWRPTFNHYDHQPFGSAVFDDVLSASLHNGYEVTDQTLYQLSQDTTQLRSILIVTEYLRLYKTDHEAFFDMLGRGNRVMLVSGDFDSFIMDTLGLKISYGYFDARRLKENVLASFERDALYCNPDSCYPNAREFRFFPHLFQTNFLTYDSIFTPLASKNPVQTDKDSLIYRPCAISARFGKGELILVSTPLLFTNYAMLDGENSGYIFRLLNRLAGQPVVRTEVYGVGLKQQAETPLRYILSQTPLRWAIYMTMCVILLFMIFTARREQRAIPIVKPPVNRALEFVRLIGTLYYQRKNHNDLVKKKYIYFAEILRRSIQVDLESDEPKEELACRIATKTGMDQSHILRLLFDLDYAIKDQIETDEEHLRHLIHGMNEIINHI